MRPIVLAVLTLFWIAPALADITRVPDDWTLTEDFGKSREARSSLSGAACARPTNICLAVNDEKKYAQFFTIDGRRLTPGPILPLLPKKVGGVKMKEIDAEAVAYAPAMKDGEDAYFYVTGSHGLSRKGDLRLSQFFVFRIPVDPATGLPAFPFGGDKPATEISRTALLREVLKSSDSLGPHAEQKLDRNGITIEGLAVDGDELLFGLRSPCISGHAQILRVSRSGLFETAAPEAHITAVKLGDNVGIRDLTKVGTGFLILSGRSDDRRGDEAQTCGEKRRPPSPKPTVWFWSGGKDDHEPIFLGELPGLKKSDSAETLLLLEETEENYRVLVLLDGVENGAPTEFNIPK